MFPHQAVGVIDTVLESSGNDVEVAVETLLSMARLRGRDAGRAVCSWRSYASLRREAMGSALDDCRIVPAALGEEIGDHAALALAVAGLNQC